MPEPLLRALDLTMRRRVEGLLPATTARPLLGRGSELAQVRPYEPVEDDVRQIDWNVTARTGHAARPRAARRAGARHVAGARHLALDDLRHGRSAQGRRRRGRVAGGRLRRDPARQPARDRHVRRRRGRATLPPRQGRPGCSACCSRCAARRRREPRPRRRDLDRRGAAAGRQPGPAARATSWSSRTSAARATGAGRCSCSRGRHEVVAVEIRDPREQELPNVRRAAARRPRDRPPAAGRHLERAPARALRRRGRAGAARGRGEIASAGARHVVLSTAGDWLRELAGFLRHAGAQ